jgi:hypothetical protein
MVTVVALGLLFMFFVVRTDRWKEENRETASSLLLLDGCFCQCWISVADLNVELPGVMGRLPENCQYCVERTLTAIQRFFSQMSRFDKGTKKNKAVASMHVACTITQSSQSPQSQQSLQ